MSRVLPLTSSVAGAPPADLWRLDAHESGRTHLLDLSEVRNSLPGNVSLVSFDVSREIEFDLFVEEEQLLSAKATRRKSTEFGLGRHAAHLALEEIGCQPQPILRGRHREPIWPQGVVGSITHDGAHVIAAAAWVRDAGGIGIDLEVSGRYFHGLENKIAWGEELAALSQLEGSARAEATTEVFSAKESIYKAHYPRIGRFFGFDVARIERCSDHLIGYFSEGFDALYPADRPMRIGRQWFDGVVLTWLVLAPEGNADDGKE